MVINIAIISTIIHFHWCVYYCYFTVVLLVCVDIILGYFCLSVCCLVVQCSQNSRSIAKTDFWNVFHRLTCPYKSTPTPKVCHFRSEQPLKVQTHKVPDVPKVFCLHISQGDKESVHLIFWSTFIFTGMLLSGSIILHRRWFCRNHRHGRFTLD